MSRFANPASEREVVLPGDCSCPGAPHDADRVWVQSDFSAIDVVVLQRATAAAGDDESPTTLAGVVLPHVRRWNLLADDGTTPPITAETLESLRPADLEAVISGIAEAVTASSSVPNRSGAPSAASPLGSASPTP